MEFEHVPLESVAAAVARARLWSADTIVALGGGSVIDAAKAVRICIAVGLARADELGAFVEHPGPLSKGLISQLSTPTTLSGSDTPAVSALPASLRASSAPIQIRQSPAA